MIENENTVNKSVAVLQRKKLDGSAHLATSVFTKNMD